MTQHELKFVASQAADTIHYRGDPTKFEVGDAAWWSMPSYKATSDTRCVFRLKTSTDSGANRAPIPI